MNALEKWRLSRASCIEPLEARIAPASVFSYTDTDGDKYSVKLYGPGTATVSPVDPAHPSGIASIVLTGTTLKSSLGITVTKAHLGDGKVSIGSISGGSIGVISAASSDLLGAGLSLTGSAAVVAFANVLNGAALTIGGDAHEAVTISLGTVGAGSHISSGEAIRALVAKSLTADSITAPALGALKTTAGGLAADVTVSGVLGSVSVAGAASGTWTAGAFGGLGIAGNLSATLISTETAAQLRSVPALGALVERGGNFTGSIFAQGNVGSVSIGAAHGIGGNVLGATVTGANIGAFSAGGNLSQSLILAGTNLGSDHAPGGSGTATDTTNAGVIGAFAVGGNVSATTVGAGLASASGSYSGSGDGIVGGSRSLIGSFRVSGMADAASLFAADALRTPPVIHGARVNPRTDPRFLVAGGLDLFAPYVNARLVNDTGASTRDGFTSDDTIIASVFDAGTVTQLQAGLDGASAAQFSSILASLKNGALTLTPAQLAALPGGSLNGLADGPHTLHLVATNSAGKTGSFDLAFTLETAVGASGAGLDVGSQTEPGNSTETGAAVVTLSGQTDPGATVILTGSGAATVANNHGAFRFSNVPLALGANGFSFHVVDLAGKTRDFSLSINRVQMSGGTDMVTTWDQNTLLAIEADGSQPTIASRTLAMEAAAVYDAVNSIDGVSGFYVSHVAPAGASLDAAVAAAAEEVLASIYPLQSATLAGELAASLASLPAGQAQTDGATVGRAIGDAILALRANDGSQTFVPYGAGSGPGVWQPTNPANMPAVNPNWPTVTPFVIQSPGLYLPSGPPSLTSAQWASDYNLTESLGASDSATRTPDETQIARFWADGQGTTTPAGHWDMIAQIASQQAGNSEAANARMYAMLNTAMADSVIVAWDAKYTYNFWRPIDAIHLGGEDGNAATTANPSWQPLEGTPSFPEYVSGHSEISGAASAILSSIFGESVSFSVASSALGGVTRSYTSFLQAAQEAGMSRIYGGIHFLTSDLDGLASGGAVGGAVAAAFAGHATPPKVAVNSFPAAANHSITISGSVSDAVSGVSSLDARIDSGPEIAVPFDANTGAFSLPLGLTIPGLHHITLLASDLLGNTAPPTDLSFNLDTAAPVISITGPAENGHISANLMLTGAATAGSNVVALTYAFDGGTPIPMHYDLSTGVFAEPLATGKLAPGAHALAVTATDAAGNTTTTHLDLTLGNELPLDLTALSPENGSSSVGVTFHPKLTFSRPVDASTLNNSDITATAGGQNLPLTIVPAADGTFAYLFFANDLPGGATVQLTVNGAAIQTADGTALDAAGTGTAGSVLHTTFRTVSTAGVQGTSISGVIADPGPDLIPHSYDDVRAGPDGIINTADDIYLHPLQGVTVYVLGQESQAVLTDATGHFTLTNVPTGDVKIVIQGMTAVNTPAGIYFPQMVMDAHVVAGAVNTIMPNMPEFYLPRVQTSVLHPISGSAPTTVGLENAAAFNLTPAQASEVSLTVLPGTAIGENGHPMANAQIGISAVPPDFVRMMLPSGVADLPFSFTVQAPGVAEFTSPVPLTIPNTSGDAPGAKEFLISYDHTTGKMSIEGTGTVSADGHTITSDPGTGITHPGWHFYAPPPPPPPPPPPADPGDNCDAEAGSIPPGQPGNDEYVAFEFTNLAHDYTIRLRSDDAGHFNTLLPAKQLYHLYIYDPGSGMIATATGTTPGAGTTFNPTSGLTLHPDTAIDSNGDGLPDDAKFAIGISPLGPPTDANGISDAVKVKAGIDPVNPAASTPIGVLAGLALSGPAKEVVLTAGASAAGNSGHLTAYVATGSYGLAIVDFTTPRQPVILSELALPGGGDATDVAVDPITGTAVVADNAGGLDFINVSDPLHPALIRSLQVSATHVKIVEGLVYATVGASVESFDLLSGTPVQSLSLGANPLTALAVHGETLYTMDSGNTLRAVEIAGDTITAHGSVTLPHGGAGLFVENGIAYATVGASFPQGGYVTANVSDPDHPALIADTQVNNNFAIAGTAMVTNGSGIGLVAGISLNPGHPTEVDLLNVSDPTKTFVFENRIPLPAAPYDLVTGDGIGVVADGAAGLQIINYLAFQNTGNPPVVSITSPVADADPNTPGIQVPEGSAIPIQVAATSDSQVTRVNLLVNGQLAATDVSAPFDFSVQAPAFSAASSTLSIQVQAIDTGGNVGASNTLTYHVVADHTAPQLIGASPLGTGFDVQSVTLLFNKAINAAAFKASGFTLTNLGADGAPGGGDDSNVPIASIVLTSPSSVAVSTAAPLPFGKYELTVDPAVISSFGGVHPAAAITDTFTSYDAAPNVAVWTSDLSGNWDDPSNWLNSHVPTATDMAIIDRVGAHPVITIGAGNHSVESVVSADPIIIDGGLTVTQGSTVFSGGFSVAGGGLLATGAGTTVTGGALSAFSGSILAQGGAHLQFSSLPAIGNASASFEADGPGSEIDFPGVTALHGATSYNFLNLRVTGGGVINANSVTAIPDGTVQITAVNAGSAINFNALTTITDTNSVYEASTLEAHVGGAVTAPNLTSLANVNLTLDGATSVLQTGPLTDLHLTNLTVQNGATENLPSITAIASVSAQGNSSVTLAGISTLASAASSATIEADGGSTINLPNLTTLHGATGYNVLYLRTTGGGIINANALASVPDGSVDIRSQDAGSAINLNALTTLNDTNSAYEYSGLEAHAGGAVNAPNLTALSYLNVTLDGAASALNTAQWSDIHLTNLTAQNGAALSLPGVASISSNAFTTTIEADTGSTVNLPNLTTLHGATGYSLEILRATGGGVINANALTSVPDGSVYIRAQDAGSAINLNSLTAINDTNSGYEYAGLEAHGGAAVKAPNLTALSYVNVVLDGAASSLNTAQWTDIHLTNLTAQNGAALNLPGVVSIASNAFSTTIEADTGSTVNLPNLTTLHGATGYSLEALRATGGGIINANALTSVPDGSVYLRAQDASSAINLNALTAINDTNSGYEYSGLEAHGGAAVSAPNLTGLSYVNVVLDGATSALNTAQWTDIHLTNLSAQNGATLNLPGVTSIASNAFSTTMEADSSSTINLPNLATLHGATGYSLANLRTTTGGIINANALTSIPDGSVDLRSQDAGSRINLNALTTINNTNSAYEFSGLEAHGGGAVNAPNLTGLSYLNATLDGAASVLNTAQWTDIHLTNLTAQNGAALNLPGVTAIASNAFSTTLEADTASTISLPNLTVLHGATGYSDLNLRSTGGGLINANALGSIPDGSVYIRAQDSGSAINLNALTTVNGASNVTYETSILDAENGAAIHLGAGTVTFTDANAIANGTLSAGTLALASGGKLSGSGTLAGSVSNLSGEVHAGSSPGTLTITGNYTQSASGALFIELGGTTVGTQYDRLIVGGSATLAGTLNISLLNSFAPIPGQTFAILTTPAGAVTGSFSTVNTPTLSGGHTITAAYDPSDVTLTVT